MGGPYCETCDYGYFMVENSIHGECEDPSKDIDTGGSSTGAPNITRRSECSNHTGLNRDINPFHKQLESMLDKIDINHIKFVKLGNITGDSSNLHFKKLLYWTLDNHPDGCLHTQNVNDIEWLVGWKGEKGVFSKALLQLGIIEKTNNAFKIVSFP